MNRSFLSLVIGNHSASCGASGSTHKINVLTYTIKKHSKLSPEDSHQGKNKGTILV